MLSDVVAYFPSTPRVGVWTAIVADQHLPARPPVPALLSESRSVTVLDLQNNRLTELGSAFADLATLTTLDISDNPLVAVPETLLHLPSLTEVTLKV